MVCVCKKINISFFKLVYGKEVECFIYLLTKKTYIGGPGDWRLSA